MKTYRSVIAGLALIAGGAAGQVPNSSSTKPAGLEVQLAALDTAVHYWTSEGRLKGRTLVVDSRPALASLDGRRVAPTQAAKRGAARDSATTAKLAASIEARPANEAELNPCVAGKRCTFTPNLAMIIVGDPVVNGDSATVTVGVSVTSGANGAGALRPVATYQVVSLVRTARGWRPISLKLAGQS